MVGSGVRTTFTVTRIIGVECLFLDLSVSLSDSLLETQLPLIYCFTRKPECRLPGGGPGTGDMRCRFLSWVRWESPPQILSTPSLPLTFTVYHRLGLVLGSRDEDPSVIRVKGSDIKL